MPRPIRSKSGAPQLASSSFTCIDTAGWVRCSSSAAAVKLSFRATAPKTRSWRSVAFRSEREASAIAYASRKKI